MTNNNESSLISERPLSSHTKCLADRLLWRSYSGILSRDCKKDNRPQQHLGLYTQFPLAGLKT